MASLIGYLSLNLGHDCGESGNHDHFRLLAGNFPDSCQPDKNDAYVIEKMVINQFVGIVMVSQKIVRFFVIMAYLKKSET